MQNAAAVKSFTILPKYNACVLESQVLLFTQWRKEESTTALMRSVNHLQPQLLPTSYPGAMFKELDPKQESVLLPCTTCHKNVLRISNQNIRYSRQMIVPSIGLNGQVVLSSSSVLVVGAGGIGSTVLLYLAGNEYYCDCLQHVM
jgi:ThiF family